MKKIGLALVMLFGSSLLTMQDAQASNKEEFFTLPGLQQGAWFTPNLDEDVFDNYGVIEKDKALDVQKMAMGADFDMYTLEGYQNFQNLKEFEIARSNITDLAQLSEMKNLEKISFHFINPAISDLTPLTRLKNLKIIEFLSLGEFTTSSTGSYAGNSSRDIMIGERAGVTDLRPLNELDSLDNVNIGTNGFYPAIRISKRDPNYSLFDPIILSKQFTKQTEYENVCVIDNEGNQNGNGTSVVNKKITWSNIPTSTDYLEFSATAMNDDNSFVYRGTHRIPIIWAE